MGLNAALLRAGAARPHVLVATVPGGTAVRLAAESQMRRRGWPAALAPADADLMLIAGAVPEEFGPVLEEVWQAVPAPRARAQAQQPSEVPGALDAARALLGDWRGQVPGAPVPHRHPGAGEPPMADRGEDRDGLKLDQLHAPLGPVLPDWPSGLVLHATLQGDVIQHAEVETVGLASAARPFWPQPWQRAADGEPVPGGEAARRLAASHLDSLGRFLAVAGWDEAAATARRLRDGALAGWPPDVLEPGVRRFARRVARSRVLAWATSGIGVLPPGDAATFGVRGPALRAAGDVTARYRCWCAGLMEAAGLLRDSSPLDPRVLEPPRGPFGGRQPPSAGLVAVLPHLLTGAEFAAARLIIASLDPDADELDAARVGAARG